MICTHTRTHIHIGFANPHLCCDTCGKPVPAWHDDNTCGCHSSAWNLPCEHQAGVTSVCPSWSPVDGCTCPEPHTPDAAAVPPDQSA